MPTHFDLNGHATLTLEARDATLARHLAARMDPYRPAGRGGPPELVLRLDETPRRWTDVQGPAGDGLVTASDGAAFAVLDGGGHLTVADPLAGGPLTFAYADGFPLARALAALILPSLQVAMPLHGSVAVHGTTVVLDGGAVCVAGWSESGKTETALALMEAGARFVSDKWTVLGADGSVSPFPARVGVRRWVLRYLPRLRASLPARASAQLAVAGVSTAATRPLRGAARRGRGGDAVDRLTSLAERASLSQSELRAAYGDRSEDPPRAPLRALAVLTTVPPGEPVEAQVIPRSWAAERLGASAAFERRRFFAVHERARYALPAHGGDLPAVSIERERAVLERVLSGVQVIGVRAPFPTDPRAVAAAVERFL